MAQDVKPLIYPFFNGVPCMFLIIGTDNFQLNRPITGFPIFISNSLLIVRSIFFKYLFLLAMFSLLYKKLEQDISLLQFFNILKIFIF